MKRKTTFIVLSVMLLVVIASVVVVIVDHIATPQGSKSSLEVPVYYEDELLFNTNGMYYLNRDACFYKGSSFLPNEASAILAAYPTNAIRVRSDGTEYAIYDTDTGYRLYLFFDSDREIPTTLGFPLVIKDLLSYSDFKDIQIGDSILDVEAVDDVTALYKKTLIDVWEINPEGAAGLAEYGHPCTTIHYLKDGILKIEYTMTTEEGLIVSNMIFDRNFVLTCADGTSVSHKIESIDLPES